MLAIQNSFAYEKAKLSLFKIHLRVRLNIHSLTTSRTLVDSSTILTANSKAET